jgi:hypothetical protein
MAIGVVAVPNLGNEFDLGTIEANKIHVKLGDGLTRDPVTGVISAIPAADVHVDDVSWNPGTNELTVTLTDATEFVVDLGTLAADKFLSSSSFDPLTNILTLVMTDASEYQIDLGDLIPVQSGVGVKGDGTSVSPIEFEASSLPYDEDWQGDEEFVIRTDANPDGARMPAEFVAELLHEYFPGVAQNVGLSGDGTVGAPLEFAAQELPHLWTNPGDPEVYFVMSVPARPAGVRITTQEAGDELWTHVIQGHAEQLIHDLLSVDVQDAFGNHLFYALP